MSGYHMNDEMHEQRKETIERLLNLNGSLSRKLCVTLNNSVNVQLNEKLSNYFSL
jgi:hypothetical protein